MHDNSDQRARLVDDLEDAIRTHVLAQMGDPSSLRGSSLTDVLLVYGTWRSRLIAARPRRVHYSRELAASPKMVEHGDAIRGLALAIQVGRPLTPHLSRRVSVVYERGCKQPSERKDRDLMVADWGIHHLHLSLEMMPSGRVRRTGDLLFAAFLRDDAYLIGVYPHRSWAISDVARTVIRNWPGVLFTRSEYATGLSQTFDDDDRKDLREAGVMMLLEVDGRVYSPPGQTTAGTPLRVTIWAQNITWGIEQLRRGPELLKALTEAGGRSLEGWGGAVRDGYYGFTNEATFVRIGSL